MTRTVSFFSFVALTSAACDFHSRVTEVPEQENQGVFHHGDEAIARFEQDLAESTRIREILHGPQGAAFAAGRGMTLERAKAGVEESIAYTRRALFRMSPAGAIARLETHLSNAQEELAMLRGPSGPDIAAERGTTLKEAVAELERRIRMYARNIEARRAAAGGMSDSGLEDDCTDPVDLDHMDPGLAWPHHTRARTRPLPG